MKLLASRRDINVFNSEAPPVNMPAVRAFIALNLIAGIGLLIVLFTAIFSRKVKRLPTWYSFCASWIVSCFSYSLLFLAGQQTSQNLNYQLCYAQAALIYALPPTTSCTTLSLLVQILLSFPDTASETPTKSSLRTSCILLIGPYTIFLVMFIGVALYMAQNPGTLVKASRGTYCNSQNPSWSRIAFSVVAVVSLAIIVVQAFLAIRLYSNPQSVKRSSHSIATTLRGLLFSLIGVITMIVAMLFTITNNHSLPLDITISIFPLLALLVFGTQKDLIQAWFCWKVPHYRAEGRGSPSLFFGRELPYCIDDLEHIPAHK